VDSIKWMGKIINFIILLKRNINRLGRDHIGSTAAIGMSFYNLY